MEVISPRRCHFLLCLLFAPALSGCLKVDLPHYNVGRDATYIVRPGDTLYAIGNRYDVDYRLLARRNRIRAPYTVFVGQQLFLWRIAPKPTYIPIPKSVKKLSRGIPAPSKSARYSKKRAGGIAGKGFPAAGRKSFMQLQWPVQGKITSRFGHRGRRTHDGIDIAAPEGTPIHAAAAGEVVYADQRLAGYGKLIIIRHRHSQFTAYAHNQRNLVRKGARVVAGDVIARVGKTGNTSTPHLHFEIRRGSTPVDPLSYLPRR